MIEGLVVLNRGHSTTHKSFLAQPCGSFAALPLLRYTDLTKSPGEILNIRRMALMAKGMDARSKGRQHSLVSTPCIESAAIALKQVTSSSTGIYAPLSHGQEKRTFIIGAQNIGYYPHYDFREGQEKGYAWAVLDAFASEHGFTFYYIALPIKRLQLSLRQGLVDFAYPDNPKWGEQNTSQTPQKYFSQPLAMAMGSTIVNKINMGKSVTSFRSLAVPFGFTPVKWLSLVENNQVRLIEVKDALAALELVILGRVSGADIEFHVARHLLKKFTEGPELTMDPTLPYDIVGFRLSSYQHQSILTLLDNFITAHPDRIAKLQKQYGIEQAENILLNLQTSK